jgi:hypothetical protein
MPHAARARADSHGARSEGVRSVMKIVVEFFRTRNADDAHAVVGRETREAANIMTQSRLRGSFRKTLDMHQRPDAMTITDANGTKLDSGVIDAESPMKKRLQP